MKQQFIYAGVTTDGRMSSVLLNCSLCRNRLSIPLYELMLAGIADLARNKYGWRIELKSSQRDTFSKPPYEILCRSCRAERSQ